MHFISSYTHHFCEDVSEFSGPAAGEFYIKIWFTSYSRKILSDFLKVICANGHPKNVFLKLQLQEIASLTVQAMSSRLCLVSPRPIYPKAG